LILVAALAAQVASAGGWTKELGSAYAKVGGDVYAAARFVAPGNSEPVTGGSYFGQQYSVYAEAGVLRSYPVQVSISAPFIVGIQSSQVFDAMGQVQLRAMTSRLGDLRPAVQLALSKKVPLAFALEAKIPLYSNDTVGAATPEFTALYPKPGDGNLDFTGWVYGGAAPWDDTFFEAGIGYQVRTEVFVGWDTNLTFADSVRFVGKGGHVFGPVIPIVSVEGTLAGGGPEAEFTRQSVAVGLNALIDTGRGFAIEPRFSAEVWARSASQGLGGGVGLSFRR